MNPERGNFGDALRIFTVSGHCKYGYFFFTPILDGMQVRPYPGKLRDQAAIFLALLRVLCVLDPA